MASLQEIHASAKLGHLSDVQRDAILRINDHKTAWDFYRSYSAQRGVQYDGSDKFPALTIYSISQGDRGPVIPPPAGFEQDTSYAWRPAWIFQKYGIAKLKPDALPAYIDPGRAVANQIISSGDIILPDGNVSQLPPTQSPSPPIEILPPITVAPPVVSVAEVVAKTSTPDAQPIQTPQIMPASQYPQPQYQMIVENGPVASSPGTVGGVATAQMGGFNLGGAILGGVSGFLTGGPGGALIGAGVGGFGGGGAQTPVSTPGFGGGSAFGGQTPGFIPGPGSGPGTPPPQTIAGIDKGLAELIAGYMGGVPGVLAQGAIDYFSTPSSSVPAPANMPAGLKTYESRFGPEIVEAMGKTIQKAPPGYVLVTKDWGGNGNQQTYAVRKDVARLYGYRKPKKPPISVGEMSALKKSARVVNKMKRVDKMVDTLLKCKPATRRR